MPMIVAGCAECKQRALPGPDDISGLVLWLRGDSVTGTNGNPITSWLDKSSQGAVYTNSLGSPNQYTFNSNDPKFNNLPTVTSPTIFSTLHPDINNGTVSQPFTIYAAFYSTTVSGDEIIISDQIDSTEFGLLNSVAYQSTPEAEFLAGAVANTPMLLCGVYNNSLSTMYANNANVALPYYSGTYPTTNLNTKIYIGYVGDANALTGNYAEILVYTGAHTTAQRNAVFNYMAQRYNQPTWSTQPFTPAALNPLAWYSSDKLITLNGSTVSAWGDQGSGAHNLTNIAPGEQPTYSASGGAGNKPYLTFATAFNTFLANTSFTLATTNSVETYVVATTSVANPGQNQFLLDLGFVNNCFYQSAAPLNLYNGSNLITVPSLTANAIFIANGTNDGSGNGTNALNGGVVQTGPIGTSTQADPYITIGSPGAEGAEGWSGRVYETLVFSPALSAGQRYNLLDYFNTKYALQAPMSLNPLFYYRSDQGITLNGGNQVTQWSDLSQNGYNLTVDIAGGATPVGYSNYGGPNNSPRLVYSSQTTMGLKNTSVPILQNGYDIFVVATTNTAFAASNNFLLNDQYPTAYVELYQQSGNSTILFSQDDTHNLAAVPPPTINVPFIVETIGLGTTNSSITLDGGTPVVGQAGPGYVSGSGGQLSVGHAGGALTGDNNYCWSGDIICIIGFSYTLSQYQRNQVLQFLSAMYGVGV